MIINRRVRVAVSFDDGRPEERCHGPALDGACPRASRDGRTACAGGQLLALAGTSRDGGRIVVGRRNERCPLADLVRPDPAPWD